MMIFVFHITLTPKKAEKYAIPIVIAIQAISYGILSYASFLDEAFSMEFRMTIKSIIMVGSIIIFGALFFKDNASKRFLTIVVILVATFIAETLVSIYYNSVLGMDGYEIKNMDFNNRIYYFIIQIIAYSIVFGISYLLLKHSRIKINRSLMLLFTIVILSFCFILSFIMTSNIKKNDLFSGTAAIITFVLSIVIIISFIFIIKKFSEQEIIKEKLMWSENTKNQEYQYYERIKEKSDEIRKIRHDIKDQLITISELIKTNTDDSISAATQIIKDLDEQIEETRLPYYTDNIIVNTLLGIKIEEAKQFGINVNTAIDLPVEIPNIDNIDLNCIFINLINNAIDANKKVINSIDRFITIKATIRNDYLIIKTENPYSKLTINSKDEMITSKADRDNHGFGLLIIKNITEKYNGVYSFDYDNQIIRSVVSLQIKAQ